MAAPMYPQPGMAAPGYQTPPDLESLRSMLRIGRLIDLIFLVIGILVFIGDLALAALAGVFAFIYIGPIVWSVLWLILGFLVYVNVGEVIRMVDQAMFVRAKEKLTIWMILGLIAGILPGIFLIIAYLKFDPVITWQRSMGGGMGAPPQNAWPAAAAPSAASPPPAAWSPPPSSQPPQPTAWTPPAQAAPAPAAAPAPPPAPVPPPAPNCPRCGQPATWIPQYSRWYCYTDAQYL